MVRNPTRHNAQRVLTDTWFARLKRVIAWLGIVFWLIISIGGFSDLVHKEVHENTADYYMPYVSIALAGLHVWMLFSAGRRARLVRDFRAYCAVLAQEPDKSIPDLAAALNRPMEEVEAQIKRMCARGYFNGYVDWQRRRMVFSTDTKGFTVVHCPGCGAATAILTTGDVCRYCGAPLTIQH